MGTPNVKFVLALSALLEGRHQTALDLFEDFVQISEPGHQNVRDAHYLSGMICYNRRHFERAKEHFRTCFDLSPGTGKDWQAMLYVGELSFFLRESQEKIDHIFASVEEALRRTESTTAVAFLKATLFLKWANSYVGTLSLEPRARHSLINNGEAVRLLKMARAALRNANGDPDSLLPVVIDHSLAQALLLVGSLDFDLNMTPSQLFAFVFQRLRRIVLTKREEIILAQCYLMLGTCGVYSDEVPMDVCEIYLEYARTQTLTVPSGVCIYSCITKELLPFLPR